MAYAVQFTIGTGNNVSIDYQSQEVNVSVTYQLEHEEGDLLAIVHDKAGEVAKAHQLAWERMRAAKRQEGTSEEMERAETAKEEVISETEVTCANGLALEVPEMDATEIEVPATVGQLMALRALLAQAGWNEPQVREHLQNNGAHQTLEELTATEASVWLVALQRAERHRLQNRTAQRTSTREAHGATQRTGPGAAQGTMHQHRHQATPAPQENYRK